MLLLRITASSEILGVATTEEVLLVNHSAQQAAISITTMARWMHTCGFHFKRREKHYSVDGHKRPETIAYRPDFTQKYLGYKIRAHHWTLISEGSLAATCVLSFHAAEASEIMEYHVDATYAFDDRLSTVHFVGSLSQRTKAFYGTG
jgi:hypothetical protein